MAIAVETERQAAREPAADTDERIALESSALTGRAAPTTILIAPWGEVRSTNGAFIVDQESARLAVEAFADHGTDIPIDYEHQSLGGVYASPTGQAPAAGWIRALEAVGPDEAGDAGPGLFAEVTWTDAAKSLIVSKEYRYLSPVVIVRKRDRRVVALHSAALTNKPAIAGMQPLVNREAIESESPADGTGAPASVNTDGAVSPGSEGALDDAVELLRLQLGLGPDDDAVTVLAAANARLSSLGQASVEREAEARVQAAMKAGKLTPAQRQWAISMALKDADLFEAWSATAPVVVVPGRTEAPTGDGGGAGPQRHRAVVASARTEFRTNPGLALLTDEQAYIDDALREAGLKPA